MVHKYEKCINMYSILNLIIELSNIHVLDSEDTMLDIYFKERPPLDPGKIRYASAMVAGDRTKGSILSTLINGLNVFTNKAIAKMTSSSTLNFDDIGFGDRPVAIFLGVPDYDRSKWFLATIFIKQAYYYLAQKCARINGKCKTPVKFICNEFGNQPPIDDMSGIITVCRARNITFDMYIQAFAQLAEKYGDKVQETIEGNCGNIIYILSHPAGKIKTISPIHLKFYRLNCASILQFSAENYLLRSKRQKRTKTIPRTCMRGISHIIRKDQFGVLRRAPSARSWEIRKARLFPF